MTRIEFKFICMQAFTLLGDETDALAETIRRSASTQCKEANLKGLYYKVANLQSLNSKRIERLQTLYKRVRDNIRLVDSDPWKPSETKSVPAKSKRNLYHVEATPPPGIADRAEPRKPCQIKAWARGRMCNPGFEHGRGAP
jgi:hypothetical protein